MWLPCFCSIHRGSSTSLNTANMALLEKAMERGMGGGAGQLWAWLALLWQLHWIATYSVTSQSRYKKRNQSILECLQEIILKSFKIFWLSMMWWKLIQAFASFYLVLESNSWKVFTAHSRICLLFINCRRFSGFFLSLATDSSQLINYNHDLIAKIYLVAISLCTVIAYNQHNYNQQIWYYFICIMTIRS